MSISCRHANGCISNVIQRHVRLRQRGNSEVFKRLRLVEKTHTVRVGVRLLELLTFPVTSELLWFSLCAVAVDVHVCC